MTSRFCDTKAARSAISALGLATSAVAVLLFSASVEGRPATAAESPLYCGASASGVPDPSPWRLPTSHGIHEFRESVVVTFPAGMSSVTLELWGGGGGGGGGSRGEPGSTGPLPRSGSGGGGGAGGSYSRLVLEVKRGVSYKFSVGAPGRGGAGQDVGAALAGEDGGETYACEGDGLVAWARGGAGGSPSLNRSTAGAGGRGRIPELSARTLASVLIRQGRDGRDGLTALFESPGRGGEGGSAIAGSITPIGASGGDGGPGGYSEAGGAGRPGGIGTIILVW